MVLIGTFGSQSAVCIFSHKIKAYLSDQFIHRMNIVIGVLFIIIGLFIFLNNGNTELEIEKAKDLLN
jgi:preprotein translocase subunit SecG